MNERIQELLNQATIDALFETKDAVNYLDNPVTKQQRQLQLEKFAELIVKETLNVALYGEEFEQARTNVKTLFGVEE